MPLKLFLLFLILFPQISWGDANSNSAQLLIGENNGTNAGRYRSLKFSNGTTTNNNDGSISVNNSSGSGGISTITDGVNTVNGATQLTVTGGTVGGSTPNATLTISGGGGNIGIGTTGFPAVYTAASTLGPAIPIANTVFVATNGNDATCVRGQIYLPCATIYQATQLAQAGDLIQVSPGQINLGNITAVSIIAAGTNYQVGDIITPTFSNTGSQTTTGGTFTVSSINVGTGAVTGLSITTRGYGYPTKTSGSTATTGGHGTGLTVRITAAANARIPDNVSLNGSGEDITIFANASTGAGNNGCAVSGGNHSRLSNFTIQGQTTSNQFQFELGFDLTTGDEASTDVLAWNIHIKNWSDGVYFRNATSNFGSGEWKFFNVWSDTQYDALNINQVDTSSNWPLTLSFYNCRFEVNAQANDTHTSFLRAFAMSSNYGGVVYNIYGGSALVNDATGDTAAYIGCFVNTSANLNASDGTFNIYGTSCTVNANGVSTNALSLSDDSTPLGQAGGGNTFWNVGPGTDYGASGLINIHSPSVITIAPQGFVTTGNIGIGTLYPSQALDIVGTARMTGFRMTTSPTSGYVLTSDSSGNGAWLASAGGSGTNYWLNDTGNVGINTSYSVGIGTISQTNKLNILGNVGIGTFSYDPYLTIAAPTGGLNVSGNVGIGTWLPLANLDIQSTNTLPFRLTYYKSGTNSPGFVFRHNKGTPQAPGPLSAGDTIFVQAYSPYGTSQYLPSNTTNTGTGNIRWYTQENTSNTAGGTGVSINLASNTTTVPQTDLLIDNQGNVGLGPQGNLSTSTVFSNTLEVSGQNTGTSGGGHGTTWMFGSDYANASIPFSPSSAGLNGGAFEGSVGIGTYISTSNLDVSGGISAGSYGGVKAAPSNGLIVSGNVGIGSASPGSLLDVAGNARMTGFNLSTSPTSGYVLTSDASGNGTWEPGGGGSTSAAGGINAVQYNSPIGTFAGKENLFSFNGTNVGIGTTNGTNAILDVRGNQYVSGNIGIGTSLLTTSALSVMDGNIGIGTWKPIDELDINQGTIRISEKTNNAKYYFLNSQVIGSPFTDDRLVMNSTGTSNGTRIWIDGSGSTTGISVAQAGNEELFLGAQSGLGYMAVYGTFNVKNSNNTASLTTLTQTGKFGVNNITPLNNLDVSGNAVIGASYAGVNTATSNGLLVQGNVGIGTVNPGQVLDVKGSIRVSTLGSTLVIASGTNGCQGQATLASGTVTVSTTCTPTTSQGIFLQDATTGSLVNIGVPTVGTVTGGTSFVINSSNALDSSNVNWYIIKAT